jgi:predicted anti-sigma-YlaC factor YlaD
MTENIHQRAQQLFGKSLVEGLSRDDQNWLEAHLRDCAECAKQTESTHELLRALRTVPIAVPRDLVARTQLRIRLRAQEAAQTSNGSALLWIITAASWLLGILSAPLVWRIFAWAGGRFDLPKLVLEFGFVLWWTVPALIAVAVVLHQRSTIHSTARRTDV